MQFYEPSQFTLLAFIPLLLILFSLGKRVGEKRLSRLGNASFIQKRLIPNLSMEKRRLGHLFIIMIFALSTLALARPQWGEEKKRVERKGVDILFLLDTSLSMLAEDIKPDRLRKSKLEIKNLIRHFKGHRVGMVAFAGSSFLQCPLTLDYAAFLLFVDALKPGYIPNPGTSLSKALEQGSGAFSKESHKYKAMILFTDGEDHEGGVIEAIEAAKKAGVRIYAVGVGTNEGAPIPLRSESGGQVSGYKKDRNGGVIITRLNPQVLEGIARETGGLYLPATASEKEIDILLKHLETLGARKLKERIISEREDHYQLFLFLAFLFLLCEMLLGEKKKLLSRLALPLLAFFVFTGFFNSPRSHVEKGNQHVEEKKYQTAVEEYRKAEVAKPKDPVIRYNLGTALYHLFQYRDAEKELEQALSAAKDSSTQSRGLYNYGNTKYRLGDFDKAIDAYKEVLNLSPKDEDAKYNLEFLRKKKSQFEKKQEERKKQNPQSQQKNQENQKKQEQQTQPQNQKKNQDQGQQQQQQSQTQNGQQQKPEEASNGGQRKEQDQEDKQQQGEEGQKGDQQQPDNQQGSEEDKDEKQAPVGRDNQETKDRPGEGGQLPEQQTGQQEQQERHEGEPQQENQGRPEEKPQTETGRAPLQGQMNQENALRILNALMESEKELKDLRRPPVDPGSREPLKDW